MQIRESFHIFLKREQGTRFHTKQVSCIIKKKIGPEAISGKADEITIIVFKKMICYEVVNHISTTHGFHMLFCSIFFPSGLLRYN